MITSFCRFNIFVTIILEAGLKDTLIAEWLFHNN